jgi:hypothetical protein
VNEKAEGEVRPATRRTSPSRPQTDPLLIAAIVGMVVLGLIVVTDLVTDGKIDPTLLTLVVSVFGPIVPALLLIRRNGGRQNGGER